MILKRMLFVCAALIAFSCQNDDKRLEEQARDAKAKELIYNNIDKGWNFATPTLNPKTQGMVGNWAELRLFLTELNEKPKSSIGAFQKKAKALSKKALDLSKNIPPPFNKPQIKARIAVLTTKINSIDLYINLDGIPDDKVIANVVSANEELRAFYRELDELVRKSEIPKEAGETDMIRMLDTARAIPNTPTPVNPMQQMQQRKPTKTVY